MFTSTTGHLGALVTAMVMLTGGAILREGAAAADPNQDEQFLALLDQEEIPALQNVPSLIDTANKICRKLDGGMTVDAVVDDMRNHAFTDPVDYPAPARRITTTIDRFITASVEAYCPGDQRKIASVMAGPAPGSNGPMHRGAACTHPAVDSLDMIHAAAWPEPTAAHGAVPVRDGAPPDPPQVPPAPPPTVQVLTPPRPVMAPPQPNQAPPPAAGPQQGGAGGSGGSGGGAGGGADPVEPSPPPTPPGLVRLAP